MDYWYVDGYGVRIRDIMPYVDREKVNQLYHKVCPDDDTESEDVLNDYTFRGEVYGNFAEFLCDLDDTDTLSYNTDGYEEEFFYYAPSYPWYLREKDPKTITEARKYILNVLGKISDASIEELSKHIGYIDAAGAL